MISIITPTYNRSHTLPRLYDSLALQTCMDFEWIIVDDGSVDETKSVVDAFIKKSNFCIRYAHQQNSGKHAALNTSGQIAKGEWLFIVDSDDALTSDAISIVIDEINRLPNSNYAGICFRKKFFDGKLIGKIINKPVVFDATPTTAGRKLEGDLAYVFRSDIFKRLPFPKIVLERFVPELYIWNMIGDAGIIKFFANKAIYQSDYLEDGYTHNFKRNLRKNPQGFLLYYASQIKREPKITNKVKMFMRALQCIYYISHPGRS